MKKLKKKIGVKKKNEKTNINLGQHFILMTQVMKPRSPQKKNYKTQFSTNKILRYQIKNTKPLSKNDKKKLKEYRSNLT
jgi:hypothetical protein